MCREGKGARLQGREGSRATPACDLGQDTTGELRSASLARMCTVVPLGQSCEDREKCTWKPMRTVKALQNYK